MTGIKEIVRLQATAVYICSEEEEEEEGAERHSCSEAEHRLSCLWEKKQVFYAKMGSCPNLKQPVFVPKSNQGIILFSDEHLFPWWGQCIDLKHLMGSNAVSKCF